MKQIKFVITGITSFRNHGVDALVVSTIEQLRLRVPGATFTVLDRAPDYDKSRLPSPDVKFVHDYTIRPLYASKARRLINGMAPSLDKDAKAAAAEIASASCVVASGGDVFCSEYGHRSLLSHLQPLKIALKNGVPFVIHAQSIGPFSTVEDREAFVQVARQAAAITVREGASFAYITETLQLPREKCHHVADPAFLLSRLPEAEGDKLFAYHRAQVGRPTIALSTSQAICHWIKSDADRHVDAWVEVVDWLRKELDANIILVPHVQEVSPLNDDRVLASAIQRRIGYDPRVTLAGGDFSSNEFKTIISRCDLVVAERMHAAIAGLSSGVPTVVIGYSIKAEGILTDLLGKELTKRRALIAIKDYLAPGASVSTVKGAWEARKELADKLAAALPGTKEKSGQAFDIIARIVRK